MESWIQDVLQSDQANISILIAVFLLGILSVFSCACNYSIIGIVAGYTGTIGSTGKTKTIFKTGFFFLIGMVISMTAVGAIIGFASESIAGNMGTYWKIAAGLISIFFGLFSMNLLPFKLPGFTIKPEKQKEGFFSSLIFGLTIGGLSLAFSTCCSPIFPIVLATSFVKGSMLWGALLMFAFALGYSLTFAAIMVGVGLGIGKTSKATKRLGTIIQYAGGILMIAIGFYLLITL
ncbi:MAG: cytochrome c biogenesis protein CcdA [Bacteroidota bacterium]